MNTLHKTLAKFPEQDIVVVGDVMLDVSVHGSVNRISPEAPVPVVQEEERTYQPGGAANVAANLAALGLRVQLYGLVGDDASADLLENTLKRRGVRCHLQRTAQPTIQKIRVFGQHQQLLRYDIEKPFQAQLDIDIPEGSMVLLSDYAKGTITRELAQALIQRHKVIVDPKPKHKTFYTGAYAITPNLQEALAMSEEQDVVAMGNALRRELHCPVIITAGSDGLYLFEEQHHHIPTKAQAVYDVTGAGDTFIATLAASLATGANLINSSILANYAAGVAVRHVGTHAVDAKSLKQALMKSHDKIKSSEEMQEIVAQLKQSGKTVVTTNGCFDILHLGHVRLLQKAKSYGDVLVLGLNTDASVKRYKGPDRPIVNQEERAEMLASLFCVDYVVLFDEDDPCALLEALKPTVHVKGGDYDPNDYERMPESKVVRENGGRVEIFPLVDGKATTNIIEAIKKT